MITLNPSPVIFNAEEHSYHLGGKTLHGITSTLIPRAFGNIYKDIPEHILQAAAERGTRIHRTIQEYEDNGEMSDIEELMSYITIKEEHNLTHIASEYIVSDNEHYATAIDHVFTDNDDIILTDIKTTDKPHYEQTALQLSINKRLFERQNPHLKVTKIAIIWLRDGKSEYRVLNGWSDDMLDALFQADIANKTFDITTTYGTLPATLADAEHKLIWLKQQQQEFTRQQKEIEEKLYDLMEAYNVKSFSGARVKLTRILPTTAKTFDTKAFQKDYPELYEQYIKTTNKSGTLRITISQ